MIHMNKSSLKPYSLRKIKVKKIKYRLLQFLLGAFSIKCWHHSLHITSPLKFRAGKTVYIYMFCISNGSYHFLFVCYCFTHKFMTSRLFYSYYLTESYCHLKDLKFLSFFIILFHFEEKRSVCLMQIVQTLIRRHVLRRLL